MTIITLSSPASFSKHKALTNANPNRSFYPHRLQNKLFFNNSRTWRIPNRVFGRNGVGSRIHPIRSPAARREPTSTEAEADGSVVVRRRGLQALLWIADIVYVLWLFLLPYAPQWEFLSVWSHVKHKQASFVVVVLAGGVCMLIFDNCFVGDPVWAISSDTINSLVGLSLNFFFVLPLMNTVGVHLIDAPVLHPVSEGLFNFVIGWTFMFAPLLFTDHKRDRYKWSLDVLWGLQMFLTNTFLIPYMALRLNDVDDEHNLRKPSQLGSLMTNGAPIVGLTGGAVCLISALWGLFGRMDGNFGSLTDRWEFLGSYLGSERLAYAFIWDIWLYTIFQPWLIGDNLQNVQKNRVGIVSYLRFVPVIGLIAYLVSLNRDEALLNE